VPRGTGAKRTIPAAGTLTTIATAMASTTMASTTATTRTPSPRREALPGGRRSVGRRLALAMETPGTASRRRRSVGRRSVGRRCPVRTQRRRAIQSRSTARRTVTPQPPTVRRQIRTVRRTNRPRPEACQSARAGGSAGPRCDRFHPVDRCPGPAEREATGHEAADPAVGLRFPERPAARGRVVRLGLGGRVVRLGLGGRVVRLGLGVPVVRLGLGGRVAVVRAVPADRVVHSVASVATSAAVTTTVPSDRTGRRRGRRGPRRLAGGISSLPRSPYSS
jgi:hypothetical protein